MPFTDCVSDDMEYNKEWLTSVADKSTSGGDKVTWGSFHAARLGYIHAANKSIACHAARVSRESHITSMQWLSMQ